MKTVLVSLYFLLISTLAFSQYDNCVLAGASPISISMATTCGSWTSNTINLANGDAAVSFPNNYCTGTGGAPTKDYWVSFIMPANTAPRFSIEFEIVGGCTSASLVDLSVSYFVGTCASFPTKGRTCNYCDATDCNNKRTFSNAAFTPGTQIYLQIFDNHDTNCDIKMNIFPTPAEDNCSSAIPFDKTKSYCNKGATNSSEAINSPGTCGPSPNKNGIHSIDNAMWFNFSVTAADPQPYSITMDNITCTGGQKAMQMMVYSASCACSKPAMDACFVACTAQEEPATTTTLTITPGANLSSPGGSVLPVGDYYLVIDGGNGADCTWSINTNVSLPVTLASFELTKNKSSVNLNWQVLQEINNKGYSVQRSSDGVNFTEIGYVEGKGDYTGVLNYGFIDYYPLKSTNYYRLRQDDINGAVHYSLIRSSSMEAEISVYPNPFSESFQLLISDASKEYRYTLLNHSGQQIVAAKCTGENSVSLLNNPTGLYRILVYDSFGEIVLNQSLVKY